MMIKFDSEKGYEKFSTQMVDVESLTLKARQKLKIEIIYLKKIVAVSQSFRDEFQKERNQHCIELYLEND